jgi:hypothetical protein
VRWLLVKAVRVIGDRRINQLRPAEIAAFQGDRLPPPVSDNEVEGERLDLFALVEGDQC